ncbi:MAG: sigma-70 family RNA polymerase sigma factor [Crocinitomicaceae bacterium]|nr:sigma-70 family RNA polymerase sigma factor [Crocinitomicaceae bacterium]
MTDIELVKGCLSGNREVQKALFDCYAGKMMAVCLRYTENREEAEDVLQEGFIKVFEKIYQWEGSGSLGGWIRTIMINTALTFLRSRKKTNGHTDLDYAEELNAGEISALDRLSAEELMELIDRMPPGYKSVFNLFAIEGYGHKEIAEMMGISESTSKTQYLKAKGWLKKALENIEKDVGEYRSTY